MSDIIELFKIKFVDCTELYCADQNKNIVYTTIGNGTGAGLSEIAKKAISSVEYETHTDFCEIVSGFCENNETIISYKSLLES